MQIFRTNKKIIKLIMINGDKSKSEKIVLRCLKELHRTSSKQPWRVINKAIMAATPLFKLITFTKKNRKKKFTKTRHLPEFIKNRKSRAALALKFIIRAASKNSEFRSFHKKLESEVSQTSEYKSTAIELKNELQDKVFSRKLYLRYFFKY